MSTPSAAAGPKESTRSRGAPGEHKPYRRADGRWCVAVELPRVLGGPRRRRTVYGPTQTDVRRMARELQALVDGGAATPDQRTPLRVVLERYLAEREPDPDDPLEGIRHSTWEGYEAHTRLHIAPYLGTLAIGDIKKPQLTQWLTQLKQDGRSVAMRRKVLVSLRTILKWAVGEGYVVRNEAAFVALPRKARSKKWMPLPAETVSSIVAAVEGHRLECLFLVALTVGARLGELLALRWDEDIDEPARTISINHTLDWIGREPVRYPNKTEKSQRSIRLPDAIWEELVLHRSAQAAERRSAGKAWTEYGLVWTRSNGQPLRGDGTGGVGDQFKRCLKRAKLRDQRFHDLRHQAASILLMLNGGNLVQVQQILGHSSHRMTVDLYGHLTTEALEHLVGLVDAYYRGLRPAA